MRPCPALVGVAVLANSMPLSSDADGRVVGFLFEEVVVKWRRW